MFAVGVASFIAIALAGVVVTAHQRTTRPASAAQLSQESRAVAGDLACPVCQGLSVADSPSQLAGQMRGMIRRKVQAGEAPAAIKQDFVQAYGDSILLAPPHRGFWLFIWWVPIVGTLLGICVVGIAVARWTGHMASPIEPALELTADEAVRYEQRLRDVLQNEQAVTLPRDEPRST